MNKILKNCSQASKQLFLQCLIDCHFTTGRVLVELPEGKARIHWRGSLDTKGGNLKPQLQPTLGGSEVKHSVLLVSCTKPPRKM